LEVLTAALEEQLTLAYPDCVHNQNCDGVQDDILEEIFKLPLQDAIRKLQCAEDYEELRLAFQQAVKMWKSNNNNNNNNKTICQNDETQRSTDPILSLSLFDQIQGGFGPPIASEEIIGAPSDEARLALLGKIVYLDGLLMDWNEIFPILRKDLNGPSFENAMELIGLHRKWFDQARSSCEYTPLQYGLCQNLLETIFANVVVGAQEKETHLTDKCRSSFLTSLVLNWRDMWLDLMLRDQYSPDLAQEMEVPMLVLFLSSSSSDGCCLVQEILAMIDPCSRWFEAWVDHVSNQRLVFLLGTQTCTLAHLWHRLKTAVTVPVHLLSVLSIMIVRLRLSLFPWKYLTMPLLKEQTVEELRSSSCSQDDVVDADETSRNITPMIDQTLAFFLDTVYNLPAHTASAAVAELKLIILHGIETILSGCKAEEVDFDPRYQKVISSLKDQPILIDRISIDLLTL